jgi:WD40 repeat protein
LHRIALRNLLGAVSWRADLVTPSPPLSASPDPTSDLDHFVIKEISRIRLDPVTKLSFDPHSHKLAVATASGVVFDGMQVQIDGGCGVQVIDRDAIAVATTNGHIFIWRPPARTVSVALRVSGKSPVFGVLDATTLLTMDGGGAIYTWDLAGERVVGEWETGVEKEVTAVLVDRQQPGIVIAGYRNGIVREFDVGTSECRVNEILPQQPNNAILRIARANAAFYSVCENGRCDLWETRLSDMRPLRQQPPLRDCAIGAWAPLMIFVSESGVAYATDMAGVVTHRFRGVEKVTACAMHPRLPVFALGTQTGEVVTFRLENP